MGEHSTCDALVPSMMADYAITEPLDYSAFDPDTSSSPNMSAGSIQHLAWETDQHVEEACAVASDRAKAIIEASDDSLLDFRDFGTTRISDGTPPLQSDANLVTFSPKLGWLPMASSKSQCN